MKNVIPSHDSSRLFQKSFLESLTRTHIAIPLTIFYGAALGFLVYSVYLGAIAPWSNLPFFLGGLVTFTLVEYLVHRFAFHINTDTPARAKFQYLFHGVHHAFPRDKTRLAMPPVASVLFATGFFALYRFVMGYYGLPFTAGFLAGYAIYLCVHYSVHAFRPPKNMLRYLWAHHARHHFQQSEAAFGVSSPLWDLVFGTMPETRQQPISSNTKRESESESGHRH